MIAVDAVGRAGPQLHDERRAGALCDGRHVVVVLAAEEHAVALAAAVLDGRVLVPPREEDAALLLRRVRERDRPANGSDRGAQLGREEPRALQGSGSRLPLRPTSRATSRSPCGLAPSAPRPPRTYAARRTGGGAPPRARRCEGRPRASRRRESQRARPTPSRARPPPAQRAKR